MIEHDVIVVSFLKKGGTVGKAALLTNDSVLQSFAPCHVKDDCLIIGPAEAGDLFQSSAGMTNGQLNSLALTFASTNIDSECAAARFIDFLVEKAKSVIPDWKMFKEMKSLVTEFVHERAKARTPSDKAIKKTEIESFLKKKGISLSDGEDGN